MTSHSNTEYDPDYTPGAKKRGNCEWQCAGVEDVDQKAG